MPQIINLLLLIVGIVAFGIGLARHGDRLESIVMLVLGVGLIALAWVSDRRRQARAEQRLRTDTDQRIAELTAAPWRAGQTLVVRGSTWVGVFLLLLVLGGGWLSWMAWHEAGVNWQLLLAGGFLCGLGLLLLPRELAGLGQPALQLDSRGFTTPVHGFIAWRDVSGIHLSAVTARDRTNYVLMFRVERFARVATKIHWSERWLAVFRLGALARGKVGVVLRDAREKPPAVHAAARFLWKQATGNDYEWNPDWSEQANQALKRSTAFASSVADPEAMERALREDSDQLRRQFDDSAKDIALVTAEIRRRVKRGKWMTGLLLVLIVLWVAWPWIRAALVH